MRIAYIHGYEGMTAPLMLAACVDAGATVEAIDTGWQALQLPSVALTRQRRRHTPAMATQIALDTAPASRLLAPATWTAWLEDLPGRSVAPRVQQRFRHLLQRFMETTATLYGVPTEEILRTHAAVLLEIVYLGSAVVLALEALEVETIVASPILLGSGVMTVDQQRFPVPHPLTAALCQGFPVHAVSTGEEWTSIAGASLITGLASRFGAPPDMTLLATGYGATAEATNRRALQLLVGDMTDPSGSERIAVLEANIDDMNPEFYEAIFERLFNQGALDVTLTPIFMKKNRPANQCTVLAPVALATKLAHIMLQETSTFGVRVYETWRHKLERFHRPVETRYGVIPVKCGVLQGHIVQAAPEYDACKRAARAHGVPVRLVYAEASRLAAAWLSDGVPLP